MIAPRRLVPRATLTRRPLPEHDATIDALSEDDRQSAIAIWRGRAEAELRAGGSFAYLATALADVGAAHELVTLARRAVTDEHRHATICWQVACALAGHELPPPRVLPVTAPSHAQASAPLRRVLHVIGMSCLNETTGSAFLEVCRAGATGALARAALHELLSDEIDHARLGWAFVASDAVDAETRRAIASWLPELLAANVAAWRQRLRRPSTPALVAQGCPDWDAVDAAVIAAIGDLLLPGFASVGVDVAPARAWLATA